MEVVIVDVLMGVIQQKSILSVYFTNHIRGFGLLDYWLASEWLSISPAELLSIFVSQFYFIPGLPWTLNSIDSILTASAYILGDHPVELEEVFPAEGSIIDADFLASVDFLDNNNLVSAIC